MFKCLRYLIHRISFRYIGSNPKKFNLITRFQLLSFYHNIFLLRLRNCDCLIGIPIALQFNTSGISVSFLEVLWNYEDITCMFFMIHQFIIIVLNWKISEPSHQLSSTILHLNLCLPHIVINLIPNSWINHRFSILYILLEKCLTIMHNHMCVDVVISVYVFHAKFLWICPISPTDVRWHWSAIS